MPVLCFRSNILLSRDRQKVLLHQAVDLVAEILGRESCRVMASYLYGEMVLGDSADPVVYTELQTIEPMDEVQCRTACAGFLSLFNRFTVLDASRIYLYFPVVQKKSTWKFVNGYPVCPGSVLSGDLERFDGK
jgi:hypothetical protein